jgi:hypothetical protein
MRKKRKNHGDGPPKVDPKKGGGVPKNRKRKCQKHQLCFIFNNQANDWAL